MGAVLESGAPRSEAHLAAIMVHGRGRPPEEMALLGERLALPGIRYYCPEAPGHSWYPGRFFDPFEVNEPALAQAFAMLTGLIDGLNADGFDDDRLVLCGFSQGGCLVADLLVRRPAAYAGAMVFTGGLIGPPGTIWRSPKPIPGVPVLLTGSETDDWVPAWRSRESASILATLGARVDSVIFPDRPHVVCDDEIARARALVEGCLASR